MLREKRTFWRKLLSLPSWERGLKFINLRCLCIFDFVAPLVGARIEILSLMYNIVSFIVAPLVGARIEIFLGAGVRLVGVTSLPSWERGLKCICCIISIHSGIVAPLVGARIEIVPNFCGIPDPVVAPLVGARIEISVYTDISIFLLSLPSWERGLKY